jgi:penicillin-binding protein 2
VIAAILVVVSLVFVVQLFNLQVLSPEFRGYADRNAQFRRTLYPARGAIYDRNGHLLVFNQPTYDVMMVTREMRQLPFDTIDFINTLNISKQRFLELDEEMRDRRRNPGFSSFTPQVFMQRLTVEEYGLLQEKLYKFPGISTRVRTERQYTYPNMGNVLGYFSEVHANQIARDPYYVRSDFIGQTGIERSYETVLRGEKGVEILLRDAHGRIQGSFRDGAEDRAPVSGSDLVLSIDIDLQAYGELLMSNKVGAIVMIEPKTGEILAMVSAPMYDPALLTGRDFGANFQMLRRNPFLPLNNRAVSGFYPPGSTFKVPLAAAFLGAGVITAETRYSCHGGFAPMGGRPGCRGHASPLGVQLSTAVSCNSFLCYALQNMLLDRRRFSSTIEGYDTLREYMLELGFGRRLGVDLPSENPGFFPTSAWITNDRKTDRWHPHNIISIALGQGEITVSPLQGANAAAMVANRGYFYTPHVVREIRDGTLDRGYTTRQTSRVESKHFELLARGMADAVTIGTATGINLSNLGITVAGKTGTAENQRGDSHSLFMGFAPVEDPQVAIFVIVENATFGARNAVPISRLMLQKYLKGEISEGDEWLEEQIINRVILPPVYLRGLPAEQRNIRLWTQVN